MKKLLVFLNRLEKANISYTLEHNREETVMAIAVVPGERWEIEFFADGQVEVEVFRSVQGVIGGEEMLDELFEKGK